MSDLTTPNIPPRHEPVGFDHAVVKLPPVIALAVTQSGILEDGGDVSWLSDAVAVRCLAFANDLHYGQARKRGPEMRLIHEIWCAHQIHNNAALNAWLDRETIPRSWALIGMILHDAIENRRDYAVVNSRPFDRDGLLQTIAAILENQALFSFLRTHCFPYMTDQAGLRDRYRLGEQKAKGYDDAGGFCLTYVQQCWRLYDKLHHVASDALFCMNELRGIAEDQRAYQRRVAAGAQYMDPAEEEALSERMAVLQGVALGCFRKAVMKIFVMGFPAAQNTPIREQYMQPLGVLKKISGTLPVDLRRTFGACAEDMTASFQSIPVAKSGSPFARWYSGQLGM